MAKKKQGRKLQAVLSALEDLFSDTSVPAQTTLDDLLEIQDAVESRIGCIRNDMEKWP